MDYPSKELYEILYAKWLARETDLTEYAKLEKGMYCIDLCCGGMRLTKKIATITKNVIHAVDTSLEMLPNKDDLNKIKETILKLCFFHGTIQEYFLSYSQKDFFDVIFCQQAINYWFLDFFPHYGKYLYNSLRKDGKFIFNTFNTKPEPFSRKFYEFQGRNYEEINTTYNDKIHHIQVCEGYPPHITIFDWISPEIYKKLLSPYFEIEKITKGKSDIYICTKGVKNE